MAAEEKPKKGRASMARQKLTRNMHAIPSERVRPKEKDTRVYMYKNAAQEPVHATSDYLTVKMNLHQQLLEHLERRQLLEITNEPALKQAVIEFVSEVADQDNFALNDKERDQLAGELTEETLGLGPLAPLMADPAVTDILVNSPDKVYVERFGRIERTGIRFRDNAHLQRLIQRIVASVGRRIDEGSPYVDARLSDGSRVNATLPPVTVDGPTLSIRRFGRNRIDQNDLLKMRSISEDMLRFLEVAIRGRKNITISGGTGAGKSTLLGALAAFIPEAERIVTIEDTVELVLDQEHVIRCETRPANIEGMGIISARDLVRNSLRMRPDRIIVGEVRGAEAFDMLQAMNTGHEGSMTTLHANSPRDALARLESMVLMAQTDLPSKAIREQFVSAVQLLVHVERQEDGVRRVTSIAEVTGMEGDTPQIQEIFKFERAGKEGSSIQGQYSATGIVPRFAEQLRGKGLDIPSSLFQKKNIKGSVL